MFEEYAARREMIYQGLVDIGLTVFKPKGAFYIFPDMSSYYGKSDGENLIKDSADLCMYLLSLYKRVTMLLFLF